MKRILLFFLGLTFTSSLLYAAVTETVTTKVTFGSSNTLTNTGTTCYKGLIKSEVSESDFEGSGLKGKMIGMFFPEGKNGTIHNLPEKQIYSIDYKDKSYTVSQIEKFFQESPTGMDMSAEEEDSAEAEDDEPNIRVIRSEFRVIDTGEKKKTAGFDTHEYQILSIFEAEDLNTGVITTDSLFVDLWNTDDTAIFDRASAEKAEFNRELFTLMGIEFENDD